MKKLHLTGFGPAWPEMLEHLGNLKDTFRSSPTPISIVDSHTEADTILILWGHDCTKIQTQAEREIFHERLQDTLAFDPHDDPIGLLDGIYTSVPYQRGMLAKYRAYCYLIENPTLETMQLARRDKTMLATFQGGPTCRLRQTIFRRKWPESFLIENTANHQEWNPHQSGWKERKETYCRNLLSCKFILCPRGAGTGSIRMFEAMQAGAVPVVISDNYVFPDGPIWSRFLIQIPERRLNEIPTILRDREPFALEMGKEARKAWETWFAPQQWFGQIARAVEDIRARRSPLHSDFDIWNRHRFLYNARRWPKRQMRNILMRMKGTARP